jgi:hypothetical protein
MVLAVRMSVFGCGLLVLTASANDPVDRRHRDMKLMCQPTQCGDLWPRGSPCAQRVVPREDCSYLLVRDDAWTSNDAFHVCVPESRRRIACAERTPRRAQALRGP